MSAQPASAGSPLVSILSPSLNQARFVRDCLASIARQDYPHVEHIVVDGGSTDGTVEILRSDGGESMRLIVEPSSQSGALNRAFAESRGEIIGWLNTDDAYFGVEAVRLAVEALSRHPRAAVVYGDAAIVDESGRVLRHVLTDASRLTRVESVSPLVQPAAFIRREVIADRFLRDDLDVAMDYELWLRLAREHDFEKVDRILAVDRDYAAAKSRARGDDLQAELAGIARDYGIPLDGRARFVRAVERLARRFRGVRPLLTLEGDYDFAYPARIDARWRRALRQVAVPQRSLSRI